MQRLYGETTENLLLSRMSALLFISTRHITDIARFTAYTENLFNNEERLELAKFVDAENQRGAKIVVNNSDPKNSSTEDDFFDHVYSSHKSKRVDATCTMNCKSES